MAGKHRIGAVIALDNEREFREAVTSAGKSLTALRSESNLVKEEFKGQANTMQALAAKHEVLEKTLKAQETKMAAVNNGLKNSKESYGKMGAELKKLENLYQQEAKKMEEMEKSSGTSEKALADQRKEVQRLSDNLKKSQNNYKLAGEKAEGWGTKLNNAKAQTLKANHALEDNKKLLDEAKRSTDGCAHSIDEYGKKTKIAVESTLDWKEAFKGGIAAKAVDQVTEKMIELGQEAINTAKEMDATSKQVQASTGISEDLAKTYTDMMKSIYANNYGEGFDDIGEAVSRVKQNMADLDDTDLQNVTESAITLRDTFGFDYQEQLRAAKMLMDTFGISARESYNLIAQGAQSGLDKNGDLLDTINEYSAHYSQMGVSAEEMFNSLTNGAAAGTFSVDKLGDAYKEFNIRVKDTANTTTEGFKLLGMDADVMRDKFAQGGESAKEATSQVLEVLYNMDDKVKQNQAGVDLFGTMWEDLGIEGVKALTNLNGEMSATKNTMESIKDIKYDDIGSQIAEITRSIQMKIVEPLEKEWLPKIKTALEFTEDHFDTIMTVSKMLAVSVAAWKLAHSKAGEVVNQVLKSVILSKEVEAAATGKQSIATNIHTAAQKTGAAVAKGFNAAISANPIGVTVIAITAAVGAYKALEKFMVNSNEALKKNREEVENACQEYQNLKSSIESAADERENTITSMEAEYTALETTADKLFDLSEQENKSNGEKALMKAYVDQLNEAMPELNLSIDEQTGKLNMSEKAVTGYTAAMKEKALAEAKQGMLKDILEEQIQAQAKLIELEKKKEDTERKIAEQKKIRASTLHMATHGYGLEAVASLTSANNALFGYRKDQKKLNKEIEDAKEVLDGSKSSYEAMEGAIEKTGESMGLTTEKTNDMSDAAANTADTISAKSKEIEETAAQMQQSLESSIDGTINLFNEFSGGQEITTQKMKENLKSQVDGLNEWKENLAYIADNAGTAMTEELYKHLVEMGPEGANAVNALAESLKAGDGQFQEICNNWTTALSVKDETQTVLVEKYRGLGENVIAGMQQGIREKAPELNQTVEQVGNQAYNTMKRSLEINSPSRKFRRGIGIFIPGGVAAGVLDGIGEVENSVTRMSKAALGAAEKELDIHSPSRKFRDMIGLNIPKGTAEGVDQGTKMLRKSTRDMSDITYKSAEDWLSKWKKKHKTTLEQEKNFWENVRVVTKKGTEDYEKASEKIRNLNFQQKVSGKGNFGVSKKDEDGKVKSVSKYNNEVLEAATSWFSAYQEQHKTTINDEVAFWTQIRKQLKKGTGAYKEATQNIAAAKKSAAQEKLSASDTALDQYKTYYQVSAKAEMQYWNTVRKQFARGTEERIEADKKYFEAKENLNSQLEGLNEEYASNCKEVQGKLKEDIKSLTDAYNDAVKERADSIYNSFGLFDQFKSESASGATLLNNLKTQVAGIADWELELQKLGSRGLPKELMDELKAMGPEASASIHALNTLTAEQLKEYSNLWKQKKDLAQSQAVVDTEPLRQQTQKDIQNLTADARKELGTLKKDYDKAVKELNTDISSALKKVANSTKKIGEDATAQLIHGITSGAKSKDTSTKLKKVSTSISSGLDNLPPAGKAIGKNTLEGILKGLNDKNKITQSAQEFIAQLKKEMQKAADIHSPSRLFEKEVGGPVADGTGSGVKKGIPRVRKIGMEMITELMKGQAAEIQKQQETLDGYRQNLNIGASTAQLNNLISATVTPQTNVTVENTGVLGVMSQMLGIMQQYFPQMAEQQLVLDTGQLVGATSGGISAEFALMSRRMR